MHDLTIGVPTRGEMPHQFVTSLMAVIGNGLVKAVDIVPGLPTHQARTKIAQRCDTEWLLFTDDDMVFQPSDVLKLMDSGKTLISGLYRRRGGKNEYIVLKKQDGEYVFDENIPEEVSKVGMTSLAFTLIHSDVLDEIGREFKFGEGFMGEDVEWLSRATEEFDMYLDPTVRIGHLQKEILR